MLQFSNQLHSYEPCYYIALSIKEFDCVTEETIQLLPSMVKWPVSLWFFFNSPSSCCFTFTSSCCFPLAFSNHFPSAFSYSFSFSSYTLLFTFLHHSLIAPTGMSTSKCLFIITTYPQCIALSYKKLPFISSGFLISYSMTASIT